MFKLLGHYIGMAARSCSAVDLALAPIFWKTLKGDVIELDDLKTFDMYGYQPLASMLDAADFLPESDFAE